MPGSRHDVRSVRLACFRPMVGLLLVAGLAACTAANPDVLDDGPARDGGDTRGGTPDTDRRPTPGAPDGGLPDVSAPEDVAVSDAERPEPDDAAPGDVLPDDTTPADTTPPPPDVSPDTAPPVSECGEVTARGESISTPVDIVWVIDTSGSMNEEANLLQTNLNAFVGYLGSAGLDYRVVMVADDTICVPEPLSAGGCPDTDSERYLHVRQVVNSTDALVQLVNTYPTWQPFLREGAALHFVVVTDDESSKDATWFLTQMAAQTPAVTDLTFHTIASLTTRQDCVFFFCFDVGCSGPHGEAEAQGARYMALSDRTGGVKFSICESDWSPVFTQIGDSVIRDAMLPCEYGIPETTFGAVVWDDVKVRINDIELPRVLDAAGCGFGEGWYYDNLVEPTRILLCPQTCGSGEVDRELEIVLGCIKA